MKVGMNLEVALKLLFERLEKGAQSGLLKPRRLSRINRLVIKFDRSNLVDSALNFASRKP